MKSFLKSFLSFSKREKNGVLVLLALIILITGASFFIDYLPQEPPPDFSTFKKEIAAFEAEQKHAGDSLDSIKIKRQLSWKQNKFPHKNGFKKMEPALLVDLNAADSSALTTLNGIGPSFASRIIKYRNRLGGFYTKEQLLEVYGLDTVLYDKIKNHISINKNSVQKININTAEFKEMKRHPYFSYNAVVAALNYRKQHGNFKEAAELKNTGVMTDQELKKLLPYLRVE